MKSLLERLRTALAARVDRVLSTIPEHSGAVVLHDTEAIHQVIRKGDVILVEGRERLSQLISAGRSEQDPGQPDAASVGVVRKRISEKQEKEKTMPRLQPVNPQTATGKAKELLDTVQKKYGMTPNLSRTLANSPAVLETYLGFGALDGGALSPALREQIALAVSEINGCDYCLAAHTAIGKMVGLSQEQIHRSREASSADSREEAALRFAKAIVEKKGWVSDEDVAWVRQADYSDGEITEIVANVVKNIFTNYFNHVAQTEVDFPAASQLGRDARSA